MTHKSFMNRAIRLLSLPAILGCVLLSGCTPHYGCYYGVSDSPATIDHQAGASVQPLSWDPECELTAE